MAGGPMRVFVPIDGSLSTTDDDKAEAVQLRWRDGDPPRFYVAEELSSPDGDIVMPEMNLNNLKKQDILDAISRALLAWNQARWGSLKFYEGINTNKFFAPVGSTNYGRSP
jgi:hypothetical protein